MEESVRPWGEYKVIEKTKILIVKPNQRISIQYHHHRDEFWTITKGNGKVLIGSVWKDTAVGDRHHIPKGTIHSIEAGNEGIEFVEIATGLVDEDDIVRIEDKYGRVKK